jgi:hypothetical protein
MSVDFAVSQLTAFTLNLSQVAIHPDCAHPVKEDVKKKYSPLPSRNTVWLASSPSLLLLLLREVFGFTALDRRVV